MVKDQRLFMTFPNDFHRHPKLTRLSVEAKWTFVEMNGEARLADNDGVFSEEEAEFLWDAGTLAELVGSHPVRPLVVHTGGRYVIREYGKHQQTRADREELSRKRAKAGRAGGSKPKARGKQLLNKPEQTEAESESESESEDYYSPSKSQSRNTRASVETDSYSSKVIEGIGNRAGIIDPAALAAEVKSWTGRDVAADRLPTLVNHYVAKSKSPVKAAQAYMVTCLRESALEVQKFIDENGLAS